MPAVSTTLDGFLRQLKQSMAAESLAALADYQLVEQFLASHDEAAFLAILRRHGPMVFGVCRRALANEQDVEDAFQGTFLVLAREGRTIRKQASLASWLHGVAYRVARKTRARAARRRECQAGAEVAVEPSALAEIRWKELRSLLDEELTRLPDKLRSPLVLCYLQGLTQDEAARQLGWSKSTCRRNLERGRDLLGARLARRGVTLSAALLAPLLCEAAAAAVPPALLLSTAQAGADVAAGKAAAVSARAVALADGIGRSGLAGKWKSLGVLLAVLVAGIGGVAGTRDARRVGPPPRSVPGENLLTPTTGSSADRGEQAPAVARRLECQFPTLILERDVQAELKLRGDQVRTIREIIQEVRGRHREDFAKLREWEAKRREANEAIRPALPLPRTDAEVRSRFAAFGRPAMVLWAEQELRGKIEADRAHALRIALPGVLTPAQGRRLRQVELHAVGLGAFADPGVVQALALTDDQKAQIQAIAQQPEDRSFLQPGSVLAVSDFLLLRRRIPRVLGILTEGQKRTWSELSGEPCQVQLGNSDLLMNIRRGYMARLQTPGVRPQLSIDAFQGTFRP
jgi:RNA polymerase sigma factor (sigma-70 family)